MTKNNIHYIIEDQQAHTQTHTTVLRLYGFCPG